MSDSNHFDAEGNAQMVDVGDKAQSRREARAMAEVHMLPETLKMVEAGTHKKGDVLGVARIAGIQAAKKCSDLIPLCHPLALSSVNIEFSIDRQANKVQIEAQCKIDAKTGVEMEALTAASIAALTIYDMCKSVDKGMTVESIALLEKSGGASGDWRRP